MELGLCGFSVVARLPSGGPRGGRRRVFRRLPADTQRRGNSSSSREGGLRVTGERVQGMLSR